MDTFLHDVRSAVRSLTTARGFTAVAVLVFALGIGINTALFSIVNAVFFKPWPVAEPERLVLLFQFWEDNRPRPELWPGDPEAFSARTDVFDGFTAHSPLTLTLILDGEAERLRAEMVRANYFDVLGVRPRLGRGLPRDGDRVDTSDPAVVISHRLWMRRFKGDPTAVGRTIRLCCRYLGGTGVGRPRFTEDDFTIVGVTPEGFKGMSDPWTPSDIWVTSAQWFNFEWVAQPIARIKAGISYEQAREAVRIQGANLIADRKRHTTPWALRNWKERWIDALPANSVRTPFNPSAVLVPAQLAVAMTVVVAVVLLIAAANIAGLLMARGITRNSDTAVRRVLGATPLRIARQLFSESLLLAAMGTAVGVLLAWWLLDLFRILTPDRFDVDAAIDMRVLVFAAIMCVIAAIVTGVAPVIQAARVNLLSALPGNATGSARNIRGRLRHVVVIPQLGLCLLLLVAAGLQVRALMRMELADLGYETRDRVVVNVGLRLDPTEHPGDNLQEKRAQRARAFYRQLRAALRDVDGVSAVALSAAVPTLISNETGDFDAIAKEDHLAGARKGVGVARATAVDADYFRTIGMRIIDGRDFDERDAPTTPQAVIVNETLARRLWPGGRAVGRSLTLQNNFPSTTEKVDWYEVVGVVNDIDPVLLDKGTLPMAYVAMGQQWAPDAEYIVAHVPGGAAAAVDALRRAATGADLFSTVYSVRTLNQLITDILYPRRMAAGILGVSALTGLLLAAVGLYGVISYSVGQRRHELGVRTTLGASRSDIVRLVLREGGVVAVAGSVFGAALSYAAVQVARGRIADMPPFDLATVIVVPVILAIVVLVACYVPARRAARVDPVESLRAL